MGEKTLKEVERNKREIAGCETGGRNDGRVGGDGIFDKRQK